MVCTHTAATNPWDPLLIQRCGSHAQPLCRLAALYPATKRSWLVLSSPDEGTPQAQSKPSEQLLNACRCSTETIHQSVNNQQNVELSLTRKRRI